MNTTELDLKSISRTVAARVHIAPGEAMSYVGDAWGKLDRREGLGRKNLLAHFRAKKQQQHKGKK